jgi:hypothetical protein
MLPGSTGVQEKLRDTTTGGELFVPDLVHLGKLAGYANSPKLAQ